MIRIENFSHYYDKVKVIDGLNLHVQAGDIYGFIGPNGAGKTTTIKVIATLLKPSSGLAFIHDKNVVKEMAYIRSIIGYMPDHFGVYQGMKVEEFLDFFGLAYGLKRKERFRVIEDIMTLLDLQNKRKSLASDLSRGMRQRLGLARTLIHDPPVLILDEPASGLDPRARIEIMELLKELQNMGKTILISSHILSELSSYCNNIGIIERGKMVAQGSLEDITQKLQPGKRISITLSNSKYIKAASEVLKKIRDVSYIEPEEESIYFYFGGDDRGVAAINAELVKADIPVVWIKDVPLNLEEIFMSLTKGSVQ